MKIFIIIFASLFLITATAAEPQQLDPAMQRELLREQLVLVRLQQQELRSRMELQRVQRMEAEESAALKRKIKKVLGDYQAEEIVRMVCTHLTRLGWFH